MPPQQQYLSTDPNAGQKASGGYLSTDPNAGQPETTPTERQPPSIADRLEQSPLHPAIRWMGWAAKNPSQAGAMVGGMATAPFTGGLSIPAAAATAGAGSAVGSAIGIAGRRATSDTPESLADNLKEVAIQGGLGALGEGGGRVLQTGLRIAGNALRGAKPAAAPSANAGGRLVKQKGPTVEQALSDVLGELRQGPKPSSVSLPPAAAQPAVSYPTGAAPKAKAPVKIAKTTPKTEKAMPEPAAPAAPQLPASWAKLVQPEAPAPAVAAMDDADLLPMWSRHVRQPGQLDDVAALRRQFGAEETGARLGMSADDVRQMTGARKPRPGVIESREMDLDYLRRIHDERGAIDMNLLKLLGRNIGLIGPGSMIGGVPGAIVGAAAANPRVTGAALYQTSKVPFPSLTRALLAELGANDDQ